jgi:mRNA interferase MazF
MLRGEVWLINLDPTIGAEIQKTRPVVILSNDAVGILPLRVVIPITEWKEHYHQAAWMVSLIPDAWNGLAKPSTADTFQIRSVSTARFVRRMGKLAAADMEAIVAAVSLVIHQPD